MGDQIDKKPARNEPNSDIDFLADEKISFTCVMGNKTLAGETVTNYSGQFTKSATDLRDNNILVHSRFSIGSSVGDVAYKDGVPVGSRLQGADGITYSIMDTIDGKSARIDKKGEEITYVTHQSDDKKNVPIDRIQDLKRKFESINFDPPCEKANK